jgi:hypothetical protein
MYVHRSTCKYLGAPTEVPLPLPMGLLNEQPASDYSSGTPPTFYLFAGQKPTPFPHPPPLSRPITTPAPCPKRAGAGMITLGKDLIIFCLRQALSRHRVSPAILPFRTGSGQGCCGGRGLSLCLSLAWPNGEKSFSPVTISLRPASRTVLIGLLVESRQVLVGYWMLVPRMSRCAVETSGVDDHLSASESHCSMREEREQERCIRTSENLVRAPGQAGVFANESEIPLQARRIRANDQISKGLSTEAANTAREAVKIDCRPCKYLASCMPSRQSTSCTAKLRRWMNCDGG